jgi:mono/diheme cytochrome c family protein
MRKRTKRKPWFLNAYRMGVFASVVLAWLARPLQAQEQEVVAAGKTEFAWSCAVCHGLDGH